MDGSRSGTARKVGLDPGSTAWGTSQRSFAATWCPTLASRQTRTTPCGGGAGVAGVFRCLARQPALLHFNKAGGSRSDKVFGLVQAGVLPSRPDRTQAGDGTYPNFYSLFFHIRSLRVSQGGRASAMRIRLCRTLIWLVYGISPLLGAF